MKLVYICHPFKDNPTANSERVRLIAKAIKNQFADNFLAVAPQIYLPLIYDEATERGAAMRACFRLLRACDEIWIEISKEVSSGMLDEMLEADTLEMKRQYFLFKDGKILLAEDKK